MNYLELINSVCRRLREPIVGTPSDNAYSLLIGEFVNDAKTYVESKWPWNALKDTVNISTVAGTAGYNLLSYNAAKSAAPLREGSRLYTNSEDHKPFVLIYDSNNSVSRLPIVSDIYQALQRTQQTLTSTRGRPSVCFFDSIDHDLIESDKTRLRLNLYPTPDAVYTVQVWAINPQSRLSNASDVLHVPYLPVILTAHLYAMYERGEELGEAIGLTSGKANEALANEISLDQEVSGTDFIFSND